MTEPIYVQEAGPQVVAGDAAPLTLPSGQVVTLQDVIVNAPGSSGPALRFRFVAPAISRQGGTVDFETASADMAHLCQTYALPHLADYGPAPEQVIISLSERPVPFGEATPDVTQFFEAYSIKGDACVWEVF